jgi:alpha-glucosidase (family GH31 glycosyl hydrolase)
LIQATLVGALVLVILFQPLFSAQPGLAQSDRPRPPLAPRWAYEPWVWEDEENDADAVISLVDGYRLRDVPVGVVIVDSPWQTNYNTFVFNSDYGSPVNLMQRLRDRNVHVILWATGFINVSSIDGPHRDESPNYREAFERGYFVNEGRTTSWEKGDGSAIDFFNPDAVAWWYRQMDKAWAYGIDGWKVDAPEGNLDEPVLTAAGPKTNREYGSAYYRAFYEYVRARRSDAIIVARPYDGGTIYAPVDALPVGWVGDQIPDWGSKGIEEALDNILASAELGYSVVGSDIGGYRPGERYDLLFMRWTQLGAFSPLMENGGRGEHRPWRLDEDVLANYRLFAKLHYQLVPYLYGLGVAAHQGGEPIIRGVDRVGRQYRLGEDLLVAPIVTRSDRRRVQLPAGARWIDFWDDDTVHAGGATIDYQADPDRMPLFFRGGAILPLQVSDNHTGHGRGGSAGWLTLLLYPDGETQRTLYPRDISQPITVTSARDDAGTRIAIGRSTERYILRIKEPTRPVTVSVTRGGVGTAVPEMATFTDLEGSTEGWFYDPADRYVWVRLVTTDGDAEFRYASGA